MTKHPYMDNEIDTVQQSEFDTKVRFINQNPRILLVEDDPLVRKVNTIYLTQLGCTVTSALTGKEAYLKFNKNIDLVLLDIGLPDTAGTSVCQQIRMHSDGLTVPIIALTAYGNHINEECLAVGFSEVATKPILIHELFHLLQRWLPKQ